MTQTSLEIFNKTIQKTDLWLSDLMSILGYNDRHAAYSALRAVLHALRNRLPIEVLAHLSAQIPMLIRGILFEGWNPTHTPVKIRHLDDFLSTVQECSSNNTLIAQNTENITRAVFEVLQNYIEKGEIDKLKKVLPSEIAELWSEIAYR